MNDQVSRPLPEGVHDSFTYTCLFCAGTVKVVASIRLPHKCKAVEDLAKLLQDASKAPCPIAFWSVAYNEPTGYGKLFTEAILAAGWRPPTPPAHAIEGTRPQTVSTIANLDALPRLTVIRDADGVVFERHTMWHEAGSRDLKYSPAITLPATVLQLGWGEE